MITQYNVTVSRDIDNHVFYILIHLGIHLN